MKLIQRPRGGGKTYEILHEVRHHGFLICMSQVSANRTIEQALSLFPESRREEWQHRIISAPSAHDKLLGTAAWQKVYIDNLEQVLAALLGRGVTTATITDIELT